MKEKPLRSLNGLGVVALALVAGIVAALTFVYLESSGGGARAAALFLVLGMVALVAAAVVALAGLYTVQPNQAAVLSLFGKYVGTVKDNGLRWNNPFYAKRRVSQRVRNF